MNLSTSLCSKARLTPSNKGRLLFTLTVGSTLTCLKLLFSLFTTTDKSKKCSVRFQKGFKRVSQVWKPCSISDLCIRLQVAERLMTIAYESGVNLFDTAEVYAAGK